MFDAKRLLGQLVANKLGGSSFSGRGRDGYDGRHGSSPLDSLARQFGGGGGGSGALVGGLASLLLGSKKGRKFGGSSMKLGGLAVVGSLAYQAYRDWQAGQASRGGAGGGGFIPAAGTSPFGRSSQPSRIFGEPPAGSPFNPGQASEEQELSLTLLRAMIAAAKADGHIDGTEQTNIFAVIDRLDLDPGEKAFVMDELRAPLDVDSIARAARGPEEAAEIYAASLLAIDVDNAAERGYLALLAARLNLDDALVAHLHRTVEEAGQTP